MLVLIGQGLSPSSSPMAKSRNDSRLPATYNRYRNGVPLPGIFWLFAIGELDGDKHCAIMDQHFGA
jgi:hypothetical protein